MNILVLNSGSSSQKISLYQIGEVIPRDPPRALWAGEIEWDKNAASVAVTDSEGIVSKSRVKVPSRAQAVEHLLHTLWSGEAPTINSASAIHAVGHRVVHGGPKYRNPCIVTQRVKA